MDHLKEGIWARSYGGQKPILVYKKEGFDLFQDMIERIKEETIGTLLRVQISRPESTEDLRRPREQRMVFSSGDQPAQKKKPVQRTEKKIGRNAPCPCGSGKKYKKCCGQ